MTIRRILSLCLALVLALGCAGALAEEDLQSQLDAANARIAELEAQVEKYYPYYIAQIVATYGEDGVILLEDMQAEYDAVSAQYQNMGISLEAYGLVDTLKRNIVETAVENAVMLDKAAELGLDQFDEATEEGFAAQADQQWEQYISSYISYFYADAEEVTDEMRAEAEQYWQDNGANKDDIAATFREAAILDAVHDYATKDVTVTEEDVQAAYEAKISLNQENYADDRNYNSDRTSGAAIAWNPEGYRAVKHVLIKFSDEQAQRYSDLQSQLTSLNAERDAIVNPPEATEAPEGAEAETTPEPTPEPRTLEQVDADIAACGMEVESLYSELMPTAKEVIEAFEGGADFDELIEKYNEDPGMQNEPTASQGYAVAANSTYWEQAFTDGAMSIENVGEISEPVYGSNGIHIIYYMADITPGAVALDEIRETVEAEAEEQKTQSVYEAQLDEWIQEANVVYHYESFGLAPEEDAEDAEVATEEAEPTDEGAEAASEEAEPTAEEAE